jgi:hypothetical protein
MEHPSLSRYHAIFQYRSQRGDQDKDKEKDNKDKDKDKDKEDETTAPGFYLYDLNSTHGYDLNDDN